jgi:hypothetical protein
MTKEVATPFLPKPDPANRQPPVVFAMTLNHTILNSNVYRNPLNAYITHTLDLLLSQ